MTDELDVEFQRIAGALLGGIGLPTDDDTRRHLLAAALREAYTTGMLYGVELAAAGLQLASALDALPEPPPHAPECRCADCQPQKETPDAGGRATASGVDE